MIKLTRTDSENEDFIGLVSLLDSELEERNGDEQTFYAQFNILDKINHVVLIYLDGKAVSCGAIKEFD
ncbi:MAG: GNAT family N-acetyltransferase, partial [Bacteroidia bacterium]|nr:GNAT family N-acetyltransferase [Bacteroidia bacterium]